jgi:hypothetical protein
MSSTDAPRVPQIVTSATEPGVLVSVVIPCLNEAGTIEQCVKQAVETLEAAGLAGEVVVADNGSDDGSAELARRAGAVVVHEPRRGYGSAYLAGFGAAQGRFIVMADADLTYDFGDIPRFVQELADGADLVMGDRMDNIHPGAMPWLHRYVGNPVLTGVLNAFFRTGVKDAHCGMRAVRRESLSALDLRTTGMEFASEMVIRAAKAGLRIEQLPIEYHPRGGESKLSSFRDGWRHLRFLLVHSPTHLFIVPGLVMCVLGALGVITVLAQLQILGERDPWFDRMRARFRLEHGLLLGGTVALAGVALCGVIVITWINRGFGSLSEERLALVAATLLIVGIQVFFSSFLLSILGLRRRS